MLSAKAALLSVIIPVYNVEPYLEQCLDSVINQTYKNLEIICINDGSTDNSLKILEKYQKKDSRIKLINQKNKGLSEARNAGLDVAKGGYIALDTEEKPVGIVISSGEELHNTLEVAKRLKTKRV